MYGQGYRTWGRFGYSTFGKIDRDSVGTNYMRHLNQKDYKPWTIKDEGTFKTLADIFLAFIHQIVMELCSGVAFYLSFKWIKQTQHTWGDDRLFHGSSGIAD